MESENAPKRQWDGDAREIESESSGRTSFLAMISVGSFAMALTILVVAMWIDGLPQMLAVAIGFLLTLISVAVGLIARLLILQNEQLDGDGLAYTGVVFGQAILLLYFLVLAPYALPEWLALGIFGIWGLGWIVYAIATASPPMRIAVLIFIFTAPILSIGVVMLRRSQVRARQRQFEYNLQKIGESLRQEMHDSPSFGPPSSGRPAMEPEPPQD